MRIIGYHTNEKIIVNSDGEVCSQPPYLDFLLEEKPDSIKVFYHMGYNLACVFKNIQLTEGEAKWLQENATLQIPPYFLKHRAGKFLSIKKGKYFGSPFANFSDMSQYKMTQFKEGETTEECLAKAKEASETGAQVYEALESLGLRPTALTSPIKAYEKVLLKQNLPTVDDMPREAAYYAYRCCVGNWLEAFQLGHWDAAYDYDINSAYPSELAKLIDIRLGRWEKADHIVPEAKYGFCKGLVTVTAPFSPVIYNTGEGHPNLTPTGSWNTYLTKRKIEFIEKWHLGTFKVEDGWFWIPEKEELVLGWTIRSLHGIKEYSTGIKREVIKRIMSGIWGKFLQTGGDGFGDFFNPVYGAEVENNTSLNVAEFALANGIMPIHVAVDGLISPKPIERAKLGGGSEIGNWKLTAEAPCVCAGSAAVALKGTEKTGDFSLDYDWLVKQIREKPEAREYIMRKLSPITMAVALQDWEKNKIGTLRETVKIVSAGRDIKRCYKEFPACGADLLSRSYTSVPWDVSMAMGIASRAAERSVE